MQAQSMYEVELPAVLSHAMGWYCIRHHQAQQRQCHTADPNELIS
jgi:hypothetical protein